MVEIGPSWSSCIIIVVGGHDVIIVFILFLFSCQLHQINNIWYFDFEILSNPELHQIPMYSPEEEMATEETNHYIQFLAQQISFPEFTITKPLQDNKKNILKTIDFETLLSYFILSYTKLGCMALRKKWLTKEPHSLRSIFPNSREVPPDIIIQFDP